MVDVNKRLDRLDKNFDRLSIALKRANSRTQFVINYSLTGILGFASLAVTFLAILLGVNLYQQHKQKEQMDKYIDRVEINLDRVKINLEKFEEESHDLLNQNKRMLEIQGYAFYSDQVPKLVNIYERIMHNVSTSLPVEKLYQEYHLNAAKESLDGYVTWYEKMYGKTPFASKIIESIKSLRDLFKELEILVWVERSLNTPREIAVSKAILEAWQQSPGPRVDFSGSLSSFGKTRLPAYRDNVEGVLQLINCTSLENDDKKTIEYIDCLKKAEEHFIGASKKYPEFTRPYSNMASVYDKLIQQMRIQGTASGLRCEDLIEFYEVAQQLQKKASTLAKNPRSRSLALNNLAYFYMDEADLINSMSKENGSCQTSVKNGMDQDEKARLLLDKSEKIIAEARSLVPIHPVVLATSAEIIAQKLKAEKSKLCLSKSKLCLSEPMETFEQERIEILSLLENAKLMGYPKESLSKKEFFKKYRKLEWLQSNEEFVTQLSEAGLLR